MLNGIFKEVYRGYGIYWFRGEGYGDETNPWCRTMAEVRAKIDARLAQEEANRLEHLKYWDTLGDTERRKWRQLCATTELSAAELAFTNRPRGQ